MPFDLEKLTGTWKTIRSSDNYREILQKMGVPADVAGKMLPTELQVVVKVTGDTVTSKTTVLGKTSENTFTLGVESEETDPKGTKRKVTPNWEGDTIVAHYPSHDGKGLALRLSRRLINDKTVRTEYKIGDLEGWMEAQKI